MTSGHDPLEDSLRVFRAATAMPSDGAATRARVLETAERRLVVRARLRRVAVGGVALLAMLSFGSAAWTALGPWRLGRAVPVQVATSPRLGPSAPPPRTPDPAPAPEAPAPPEAPAAPEAPAPPRPGLEASVYARAHEAHFTRDEPRAALVAWNRYLRQFPEGDFAPDARYNRALCLVRLGRLDEASRALRPFATGAFHGYRRLEATALLDWIELQGGGAAP